MNDGRLGLHQLVLALASLGSISYLGATGVLSGDAVAGMIGALVAFITGAQATATYTEKKNGNGGST